ncbi:sigma-70 family RNA polymerase sigma factor [Prolixibacteraceae bacterium JC049]|nr:sigma-70 family RNA polymerase sigma factor [Prolixibacteraceae bacterium JC049]
MKKMIDYTKEEILNGILKNDNLVLQYVYKKYFYKINFYIRKNSGNDDDAHDIFQEAIIIVYRRLKENRLEITGASFETYLFAVCKMLWLKQLDIRKNEKVDYYEDQGFIEDVDAEDLQEVVEKHERYRLYQKHFKNLGKDCQKILQLYFDKVPLKQVAQIMGYKSEMYAKKRKYKCKEYLVKSIKQDLDYKSRIEDGT